MKSRGSWFFRASVAVGAACFGTARAPAGDEPLSADVCVYAATPSGVMAAVAADREGRSVLVIEPSRWVGGILGAGIKPRQDCPEPRAVGGLAARTMEYPDDPAEILRRFRWMLDERQIPIVFEHRVRSVEMRGPRLARLHLEHAPPDELGVPASEALPGPGKVVEAAVFIDASYEGDLMARAGVAYAVGREPQGRYGEAPAGVGPPTAFAPIDPHVTPGDPSSGLLPLVEEDHGLPPGSGDDYTQAYNFRFYVTTDPDRRADLEPPEDYDPRRFELVGRYVEWLVQGGERDRLGEIFPGWKNSGEYNYQRKSLFTIAPLGLSRLYQDGDHATRSRVWREHIDYLRGLHHFLSTDPRVPEDFRRSTAKIGLDATKHPETRGWPHQLYVRVTRRMAGRYVLTHEDVLNRQPIEDSVGLALYGVDTYPVRRIVARDDRGRLGVATEGNMFLGGSRGTGVPYPVPYRALTPRREECTNLLVPVAFSASYIAYASARMEPVFMVLGESSGVAASLAAASGEPVQDVDVPALQARLRALGQVLSWPPESDPDDGPAHGAAAAPNATGPPAARSQDGGEPRGVSVSRAAPKFDR